MSVSGARYGQGLIALDDPRHGSERGYAAGCRLDCCRVAHRDYTKIKKIERIARGIPERVHGTANAYNNYNCRCDACQIAMLKAEGRRKRARFKDHPTTEIGSACRSKPHLPQ